MNPFGSDSQEWNELARYLADELSPEERDRFEHEAAVRGGVSLAQARTIWAAAGEPDGSWDAVAALERIKQRADALPPLPFQPRRHEPLLRFGAAASIAIISLAAGWFLTRRAPAPPADESSPPAMAELATLPGQRADLLLPDGSRVTLGMDSRLRYPVRYAGSTRDLYLDGEAYFQVIRDSTMPFRVHTRRGVTEDLGTAFNIRAFGGGDLSVVVAEGAVVLRPLLGDDLGLAANTPPADSLVLGAADLGRVDSKGRLSLRRDVDVASYLAWRQDRLVFNNTPLPEVLERLHTWYGMDIELGDPALVSRTFNASFDGEPANRVLDVLALTVKLRYERRGTLTLVYSAPHVSGVAR